MKTPLLNALMHLKINGPKLSDAQAVENLISDAFDTWNTIKPRVPQRGTRHERPRQKRKVTSLMSLLKEMQADRDRDLAVVEGPQNQAEQQQMQLAAIEDYSEEQAAEQSLAILPVPPLIAAAALKNKMVVVKHATAWYVGKIVGQFSPKSTKREAGFYKIRWDKNYADETDGEHWQACIDKDLTTHDLERLQYGVDGDWVLVEKATVAE